MKYKPNEEKPEDIIQEVIIEAVKIEEDSPKKEVDSKETVKLLIGNIQKQTALAKLAIKSLEDYVITLRDTLYEDND